MRGAATWCLVAFVAIAACRTRPQLDSRWAMREPVPALGIAAEPVRPLGLDLYRPVPAANPLTTEKIALGRRLFHDRRLSRGGSMACATCHSPERAFADGRAVAVGAGGANGRRNVPTIINRAWGRSFFWDGRTASLEDQALHPIFNPLELGGSRDELLRLIRSPNYRRGFNRAFGGAEPDLEGVAQALASYVRTILSGDSPLDRFLAGDRSALTAAAQRGLAVFQSRGGCTACHAGPTFTDEEFHNTGVAWDARSGEFRDRGRGAVTAARDDVGAFKTPTLRDVARTKPYMHDGSLPTLEDVVEFYSQGGRRNPHLDPKVRPLDLAPRDKRDLVAFLRSLTGRVSEGR